MGLWDEVGSPRSLGKVAAKLAATSSPGVSAAAVSLLSWTVSHRRRRRVCQTAIDIDGRGPPHPPSVRHSPVRLSVRPR